MEEGTSKSPSNSQSTEVPDDCWCDDPFQWDVREDCEVRQILDRIADKWSLLVISLLDLRTLRFTELRREIDGISQRMLTVTLRQLERDGLIKRTVHPVVPPRVEYELTALGCTLLTTIRPLVTWTEEHRLEIAAARAAYDARTGTEARETTAASDGPVARAKADGSAGRVPRGRVPAGAAGAGTGAAGAAGAGEADTTR